MPDLPLPLPTGGLAGRRPGGVVSVVAENGRTVVLTSLLKVPPDKAQGNVVDAYEVRCFGSDAAKPVWSKVCPAAGERRYTGGYLWGIPRRNTPVLQSSTLHGSATGFLSRRGDAADPLSQWRHRIRDLAVGTALGISARFHRSQRVVALHRKIRHRGVRGREDETGRRS